MDAGRRHKASGSETKDFILRAQQIPWPSAYLHQFLLLRSSPGQCGWTPKDACTMLSERNPDLREHESFMWSGKHAGPLLSSKVVHSTNVFWKESLEPKAISVSVARRVEMQETRENQLSKKNCPLSGSASSYSATVIGKKQLWPNHNVFYEKLDKEGRICFMLGSPKAEFKMKIHMETLSQNNPGREWGKQQRGDSSQVLWQKAWSWRKTLELRWYVRVLTWETGSGLPNCYPLKSLAKSTTMGHSSSLYL